MSYRFRTGDKGELVLQVSFRPEGFDAATGQRLPEDYRDATVADIPVGDPFTPDKNKITIRNFSSNPIRIVGSGWAQ